ncbi:methionyl-tRNA formyltransferase [Coprothermobacter platensis]|jgi:methionyl-tRNA formyltransferase|uniref:methionyl-tRNA formyltransferase n=1 Tax=Coprothermobacter platensis TaxID=108819 RepID=UPI000367C8ED|nr:methionyl-tRNA formyltransferase [Coprothermobacter platensis]
MKIAFFSSGSFGLPILEHLVNDGHDVTLITKSDTVAGRGLHIKACPPASLAEQLCVPTYKVNTLKGDFIEWYKMQDFYLSVVVDFGFFIPKSIFSLERPIMVNIHPSLLPKYRGPNPIRRALWNGDSVTGVSLIKVASKMDEGDIYLQERLNIEPEDDFLSLTNKLQKLSMKLLDQFISKIQFEIPSSVPQSGEASYAPKFDADEEWINWHRSASAISNQVRALADVGAKTTYDGKLMKVYQARENAVPLDKVLIPGHFLVYGKQLFVGTGNGVLEILSLQLEGRKKQETSSFVVGIRQKEGVFGD